MKKHLTIKRFIAIAFCSVFCSTIWITGTAFSASLENQIEVLKKQMNKMQQQMESMQTQLQKAQHDASSAQQQAETATRTVEEKVAEVSGKFKIIDDLHKKFSHIKIGGYVRSRWWDGQGEQNSFDVTEIAFNLRYDVSENVSGVFHLWWHPSGNSNTARQPETGRYNNWAGPNLFIESAYAEFRNLNLGPLNGKLIVGKTRNQAYGIVPGGGPNGRVTSDYGLFHESNGQSRITGIQYMTTYKNVTWNTAVFNGWGLWNTLYGGRPGGVRYLRTSQMNLDDDSNKAYSTRLGWKPARNLKFGATFFRSKLTDNDLNQLNSSMGRDLLRNPADDNEHMRYGLDLSYDKGPFSFKAEYFQGEISNIEANWWYVMAGIKVQRFKMDFYLRYAQANYDQHRITDLSASGAWDKSQITPLVIYHLHNRVKLYFEYYFNWEDAPTGTHHRDNNFGFVELILLY